jgi:2-C-methyl-D-erythritol 4-phosphate cytidylyltransferase
MGASVPKQFLSLAGKPVLVHSLERFLQAGYDGVFCLVVPAEYMEESARILDTVDQGGRHVRVVAGGRHRHESTIRGLRVILAAAASGDMVLIHDVARPIVEESELERLIGALPETGDESVGIASLVAPITETLVRASRLPGPLECTVNRQEYFAVKTPQAARIFRLEAMLAAERGEGREYTDLLTWGEAHGVRGRLVAAGPRNVKLTHPADLPYLERLLDSSD